MGLARNSRRGTLELGTEDTDEQSRKACTAPAVESSASAGLHATSGPPVTVYVNRSEQNHAAENAPEPTCAIF